MTLADIQARLNEILARSTELADIEQPSEEENAEFEALSEEFNTLDEKRTTLIDRNEKLEAIRAAASDPRNVVAGDSRDDINDAEGDNDTRRGNPWDLDAAVRSTPAELNHRARSAVEEARGFSPAGREMLTRWLEDTEDGPSQEVARYIVATTSGDYVRNFRKVMSAWMRGQRDASAETFLTRAMSIGTTTAGGFAVPEQMDPNVVWLDAGTLNAVRRLARVVQATGDTWEGLTGTPGSWSWDAEAVEVSDDSVTLGRPSVSIHMARGFIPFSIEVQGDYPGFLGDMQTALVRGRDTLEGEAHIDGTGTGQPFGITVALAGGGQEINTATLATFAIADVYTTQETLAARYRSASSWLGHNAVGNAIRQFDTSGGAGLWERIGADRPALLLGRPYVESEEMDSDVTTTGQEILVYGDFSNYVIADRIGMSVELVPHLFGATNRFPTGQRGLFAYFRSGADSINDLGFVQLQVQ